MNPTSAPTTLRERIPHLDILRGFALLGVLLSNVHFWFRAPRGHQNLLLVAWPGLGDVSATWLLRLLVDSKAIFIFSMMFGVGLAIQAERAGGEGFGARMSRRLGVLAVIGALHVVLLWNGDILLPYACLGFLALPFVRRTRRTVGIWALALYVLVFGLVLAGDLAKALGPALAAPTPEGFRAWDQGERDFIGGLARHYQDSSWFAVSRFRVVDYVRILKESIPGFITVFINLLTGIWLWKTGLLRNPEAHRAALRRFVAWSIPLGLLFHAIYASKMAITVWGYGQPWAIRRFLPLVMDGAMLLGALLLSFGFASWILLGAHGGRWKGWLSHLAPLGRMALSAYLMQSLCMTAVFYGWGLGLYNRMGPLAGVVLGLGFFALQMVLCRWWLSHFCFGPIEWAWRCLTYGARQPFRRMPLRESSPVCQEP